jgi:hypothetical protein
MVYAVRLPDGSIIQNIPDSVTEEEARAKILADRPELGNPNVTLGGIAGDVGASAYKGLAQVAQLPGQLYGLLGGDMKSGAMTGPQEHIDWANSVMSEASKTRAAMADATISKAAKEGLLEEFVATVKTYITDPVLLSNFLTEQVPTMIALGGIGRVAKGLFSTAYGLGEVGAKALTPTAAKAAEAAVGRATERTIRGAGAVQQGADVGADTYTAALELVKKQYPDMPLEQQQEIALSKARVAAIEGGALSFAAQKLPGGRTIERKLAGLPGEGRLRGLGGEALSEIVEEAGGKFASNIGLQEIDPNQSLTAGIGQAAGMAAIGGGTMGALTGARPSVPEAAVVPPAAPAITSTLPAPNITLTPEEQVRVDAQVSRLVKLNGLPQVDAFNIAMGAINSEREADALIAAGVANVSQPIPTGDGVGAAVVSQPGAGIPTAGTVEAQPDGLAPTQQAPAPPVGGAATQPTALAPAEAFANILNTDSVYSNWSNVRDGSDRSSMLDQMVGAANIYSPIATPENLAEVAKDLSGFKWFRAASPEQKTAALDALVTKTAPAAVAPPPVAPAPAPAPAPTYGYAPVPIVPKASTAPVTETKQETLVEPAVDPMYDQAVKLVVDNQRASTLLIQKELGIGFNRASKLLEQMEQAGVVSARNEKSVRTVLTNKEQTNGTQATETQQTEPQEQAAATATPEFFANLGIPPQAGIRKRLAGKDVTSPEFHAELLTHAANPKVSAATKTSIAKHIGIPEEDWGFARGVEVESPDLTPVQRKYIKEGDTVGALTDLASDTNTSDLNRAVASKLATLLQETSSYEVEGLKDEKSTPAMGKAVSTKIELDAKTGMSQEILLHEGTHAAVDRVLSMPEEKLTPTQRAAKQELKALFEAAKKDPSITSMNAKSSLQEFAAEVLSNRNLQEQLRSKKWKMSDAFTNFVSTILRLVGFTKAETETMLGAGIKSVEALMIPSERRNRASEREPGVPTSNSAKDIAALDNGSNSMREFANQFGAEYIKQPDRTAEQAEAIGDLILAKILDSIFNRSRANQPIYIELPTADTLNFGVRINGQPYDKNNPLHYVMATGEDFKTIYDAPDIDERRRVATKIATDRLRGFKGLVESLRYSSEFTSVERAIVAKAAGKYSVISDNKGKLKLAVMDSNNRHMPAVVSAADAAFVIQKLREGKSIKVAFLEGLQDNADRNVKKNNSTHKTGWEKFEQANSEEAAQKLNAAAAGTPWCTGASYMDYARNHIKGGDFYIYYSDGKPEVAVRMNGKDSISEIRGNSPGQALNPEQQEITRAFLETKKFNGYAEYAKEFGNKAALTKLASTGDFPLENVMNFDFSRAAKINRRTIQDLLKFNNIDGYNSRYRPDPSSTVLDFFQDKITQAVKDAIDKGYVPFPVSVNTEPFHANDWRIGMEDFSSYETLRERYNRGIPVSVVFDFNDNTINIPAGQLVSVNELTMSIGSNAVRFTNLKKANKVVVREGDTIIFPSLAKVGTLVITSPYISATGNVTVTLPKGAVVDDLQFAPPSKGYNPRGNDRLENDLEDSLTIKGAKIVLGVSGDYEITTSGKLPVTVHLPDTLYVPERQGTTINYGWELRTALHETKERWRITFETDKAMPPMTDQQAFSIVIDGLPADVALPIIAATDDPGGQLDLFDKRRIAARIINEYVATNGIEAIHQKLNEMFPPDNQLVTKLGDIDAPKRIASTPPIEEMVSAPEAPSYARAAKEEEAFDTKSDEEVAATKAANKAINDVNAALKKLAESRSAEESAKQANVLYALKNGKPVLPILKSMWKGLNAAKINTLLFGAPNDVVAAWGAEVGLTELKNTNELIERMHGLTYTFRKGAGDIIEFANRAIEKDPSIAQKLGDIKAVTTISQVDPSTDRRVPKLNALWDSLGSDGQRIYNDMRDWSLGMIEFYRHSLTDQVNALQSDGKAAKEGKKIILSMIKKMYETESKINPYFHLSRPNGEIWIETKIKNKLGFYIYHTTAERDAVAATIAKAQGKTVEEMIGDSELRMGNTLESARNADANATLAPVLTKIFAAIDDNVAGMSADEDTVSKLKDSIYQMYLSSLPEESFRKAYQHRKEYSGFTTTAIENFSRASMTMSSQLARAKYGPLLRNSILQARGLIKNSPDRLKQEPFVSTMSERVELELNPNASVTRGMAAKAEKTVDATASLLTRLSYIHYLSAASSALVNFTGVIYGMANLGARHGYANTAREFFKISKVWNEFGSAKDAEGKKRLALGFVPTFSITDSKSVAKSEDERRAIKDMLARGVSEITITGEMLKRSQFPQDKTSWVKDRANTIVGGLFHASERLSREVLYLLSYRMTRTEKNKDGTLKTHEQAVEQAIKDTYDSLGNMAQHNRPPILRGAAGRVSLQFMMYNLFQTIRVVSTFRSIFTSQDPEVKKQMIKEFAGIMGVTWMLAGTVGLPFVNTIVGFVASALQHMSGDDDDPASLKNMDFILWVNTVFLPEMLGETNIGGVPLSDIISNGPANAITGIDIQSRTSLANMWFREGKETRTPREGVINYAVERAGPAANMVLSYIDAFTALQNGDTQKGMEKLLPAIVRGPLVSYKYFYEGAKGVRGEQILSNDSFTTGALLGQAIGFRSDVLANVQDINFKFYSLDQKIKFQRENILTNLKDAYIKEDTARFDKFMAEVDKFNRKYPYETVVITSDSILRSIEKSNKARAESYKGVELSPLNMGLFGEAMQPSRRRAEALESR